MGVQTVQTVQTVQRMQSVVGAMGAATVLGVPFPRAVGAAVRRVDDGLPAVLFADEAASLSPRAVPKRRLQFALGRAAAHDALAALGRQSSPVGRGERGEPLWPEDVTGSITHSGGVAVAVVGWRREYAAIGIDLEMREPGLSTGAARLVCSDNELAWAEEATGVDERRLRRTMVFCAKEAVFKALYPLGGVWLGFEDAALVWMGDEEAFEVVLRRDAGGGYRAGYRMRAACQMSEGVLFAATWVGTPP